MTCLFPASPETLLPALNQFKMLGFIKQFVTIGNAQPAQGQALEVGGLGSLPLPAYTLLTFKFRQGWVQSHLMQMHEARQGRPVQQGQRFPWFARAEEGKAGLIRRIWQAFRPQIQAKKYVRLFGDRRFSWPEHGQPLPFEIDEIEDERACQD